MNQPKKLRRNKNFKPLDVEPDDEVLANGMFHFNITKLMEYILKNPRIYPTEIIHVKAFPRYSSASLNEATIRDADLDRPILIGEISPGNYNVIDGNHRIEKARRENRETIKAYRVSVPDHVRFLKSAEAYDRFFRYWNEKVDTLTRHQRILKNAAVDLAAI